MRTPFIIAEAGSSHDADWQKMLRLIQIAKMADADAFKTQWASSGTRVAERMHAPEHASLYQRYLCWPREWLPEIAARAHAEGLEFLCTVDCEEDIAVVAPHVDRFKVASWGATDAEFIKAHLEYDKPVVVSTGACDADDCAKMLIDDGLPDYWMSAAPGKLARGDWLLHCVSAYPAPLDELNLSLLSSTAFDGFSDHTGRVLTGAFAVCAGARVLEVHFRADDTDPRNPDFAVSHPPKKLKSYIFLARQAAAAMGDGVKRVMPSEEKNLRHRYVPA